VVYGLLRTKDAVSNVPAQAVAGSIGMFALFYLVLFVSFFVFARKWLRQGPDLTLLPPPEPARFVAAPSQACH
jgi:cytochrome d ubiquinol oxidase subunit I